MSVGISEQSRSSTDFASKNIYNSPKKASPDRLGQTPFCIGQEKSLPIRHKLATRVTQSELITRQIQHASFKGDDILLANILNSVSEDLRKILANNPDECGNTPLFLCIESNNPRCLQLLLKAGANPFHKNGPEKENFLHVTAYFGRTELIEVFLKNVHKDVVKALINDPDQEENTPLLNCAHSKSVIGVELLLKAGANPLRINREGENFLHIAAYNGRSALIKTFLEAVPKRVTKALINHCDENGDTPLLRSARSKSVKGMRLLLKAKADPLICNHEGRFPYLEAVQKRHASMVRLLVKKDPKQKGLFSLFNLGHAFGKELQPVLFGKKIAFPGSASSFWAACISLNLRKLSVCEKIFSCCTKKQCKELENAFVLAAAKNLPFKKIVRKIHEGRLVIVPAGWGNHTISLVFKDDYLIVCNRGEGCVDKDTQAQTFFMGKISLNLVTEELLKRFFDIDDGEVEQGIKFFYKELPQALNAREDGFCRKAMAIAPKLAKANTCGYTSMKAALRAGLVLLTKDPLDARTMAKAWATKHRQSALEIFSKTPSPFDKGFCKKTIDEMSDRLRKRN
jgi:ankyrin repeat protein